MARVRVLYFAGLREAVGLPEEDIDVPTSVRTVGELCTLLAARHDGYRARRTHVRAALNEAFAQDDEPVREGDVLALLPPVAGG
jgi:molybdopterin synthase sulfur carrier subunit